MVKLFRELATKAFSIVKDEVEVSAQRARRRSLDQLGLDSWWALIVLI